MKTAEKKQEKKKINVDKIIEESGFDKKDLKDLTDMYRFRSYTGNEEPLRQYIKSRLENMGVDYVNYNGNIIGLNHDNAVLISAHMDMVNTDRWIIKNREDSLDGEFTIDEASNIRLFRKDKTATQTSLGADDKNGIWIALKLLEEGKPVNFIFSHGEEGGCIGIRQVIDHIDIAREINKKTRFALIMDRRNSSDIIGYGNQYCLALDDKLQDFAKENGYKYKCASGLCSDANHISDLVECANLSVGYYNAHSSTEFTNLRELRTAYDFVVKILNDFNYKSVSIDRICEFKRIRNKIKEVVVEKPKQLSIVKSRKKNNKDKNPEALDICLESMDDPYVIENKNEIIDSGYCPNCGTYMAVIEAEIDKETYIENKLIDNIRYYCPECASESTFLMKTKGGIF